MFCVCVWGGICITATSYTLEIHHDLTSEKGGSPRYLRERPECHHWTDQVSVFKVANSPKDTPCLCFIEVSLTPSTKVPPLSLCELDFEREQKRGKVTMLWLLMFSSSHILFLTLVWVFFSFISYISPWNSLVCVSPTPYSMPDYVTLLSQCVLLLYISHTLSSLFHPLTCLTLHPSSVCHPCKGPAYKTHASSWPCVV